ncbi:UNVERIFIED_CONTAM: hypothetical protein FKN15_036717 [Acipenser sinensis]
MGEIGAPSAVDGSVQLAGEATPVRLQIQPKAAPSQAVLYSGTIDCFRKTVAREGPEAQWVSHRPIGVYLHSGEWMSAGYRPLEDTDQPSESPPPSSLSAWPVGVMAER